MEKRKKIKDEKVAEESFANLHSKLLYQILEKNDDVKILSK